jgi:hypothetical protein
MFVSELKTIDCANFLLEYADDSTLICPENSVISVKDEMASLVSWSTENKLEINLLKTKEMVFHRLSPRHFIPLPPPLPVNINWDCIFKMFGVTLCSDLRFGERISQVLDTCNQCLYLICQLKKPRFTRFWYKNCF